MEWRNSFLDVVVNVEAVMASDHSPLILFN
jgi:hypothetical protein